MSFFASAEGHLLSDFAKEAVVERSNERGNESEDGVSERRVAKACYLREVDMVLTY